MKTLINIRGTSGSGKSHIVRAVMGCYTNKLPVRLEGRKQPYYYVCSTAGLDELAILGHYESACGGCDTISTADEIYKLVAQLGEHRNVLWEGLLTSTEVRRVRELGCLVHVIFLDTPIELCLDSVNLRRKARGVEEPVNPENTTSKRKGVHAVMDRIVKRGEAPNAVAYYLNRDAALAQVKHLLGLTPGSIGHAPLGAAAPAPEPAPGTLDDKWANYWGTKCANTNEAR